LTQPSPISFAGAVFVAADLFFNVRRDQLIALVARYGSDHIFSSRFLDEAEPIVLAYMSFRAQHRAKLHSTNPLEHVNGEIKRRTEVVGIFPNDEAITRLVGAIPPEQNAEWAVQRGRYITLETIAPLGDDPAVSLPAADYLALPG
jgi:hypothetical protein